MLHDYYQQRGGEDACFEEEATLLEAHGHAVERFTLHNDSISGMGKAVLAARTIWNVDVYRALRQRIRAFQPTVVHAHNIFPLISPAAYHAAAAEAVPMVQSVHNFRLRCVNAMLFRDGHPCTQCLTLAVAWPGIRHRCYRGSMALSGIVAAMLAAHRALGSWRDRIQRLIAPSDFVRRTLIEGGVSSARIIVKPNFVLDDPGIGSRVRESYALFAGRLSSEKGISTLIKAWRRLRGPMRLHIVGEGPMAQQAASLAGCDPRIALLGYRSGEEVRALMRDAAVALVPSEWPEPFGRVVIEAFAAGTPVLAARIGALADLVEDRRTGRLFSPGNPDDLARCLTEMLADTSMLQAMGNAARAEFLARYTAAANHRSLMGIYDEAMLASTGAAPTGSARP